MTCKIEHPCPMETIERDAKTFTVRAENGNYRVRANSTQQAFQLYTADKHAVTQLGLVLGVSTAREPADT